MLCWEHSCEGKYAATRLSVQCNVSKNRSMAPQLHVNLLKEVSATGRGEDQQLLLWSRLAQARCMLHMSMQAQINHTHKGDAMMPVCIVAGDSCCSVRPAEAWKLTVLLGACLWECWQGSALCWVTL